MAASSSDRTLGGINSNDYREASPLKLGAEHIPFPCSLRELVLDRYSEPPGVGSNAHPMQIEELLEYLKKIDDFSLSPWVAVVGQTEAMGDPATPSREQVAILRWLGKALELWEKQFPLEARIAAQVRRLKPLSAAFAVIDPTFMQPGAHPLHQLLDSIQARAIGWQARLDRVGTVLEQQITRAIDDSRKWFDDGSADLAGICAEFSAAAERDQARAQRMVHRVVEAEAGKAKTTAAKQEAALMINSALEKYPAPEEIGDFIKGPWYTSAQLLLLKFGSDSDQWREMSDTTVTLLDSLQSLEEATEERRQHIFAVVTQLPKEMRRWLLSLHHDTEAVNEAMGLVEFTHLKILRRQELDLQLIAPIAVEGEDVIAGDRQIQSELRKWDEGQWFNVETEEDGIVRMQLVLKVEQSQQLIFTNLAGIKVLQLSFSAFARLLDQKKAKPLYSGASFSLCLANAVGVDTVEIMDALVSALSENDLMPEPTPENALESVTPAESLPEQPTPTPVDEETGLASPPGTTPGLTPAMQDNQAPLTSLADNAAGDIPGPGQELAIAATQESAPAAPSAGPYVSQLRHDELSARDKTSSSGTLFDKAQEIKARGGYFGQTLEDVKTPAQAAATDYVEQDKIFIQTPSRPFQTTPPVEQPEFSTEEAIDPSAQEQLNERQINLPMGAWLGFHDGEVPLMAKLAVHDTEEDYFIFVNRKGVKMRQITRLKLLELIDAGMVDILQTSSNFREAVTEVRKNLDH